MRGESSFGTISTDLFFHIEHEEKIAGQIHGVCHRRGGARGRIRTSRSSQRVPQKGQSTSVTDRKGAIEVEDECLKTPPRFMV
ncbi:MAG TPA: hypothetical protein PLN56_06340 [Methanoregulaceae archaeon]|nr:MAG: hypothetical protein IPI71_01945 [Methanolinea sp.]HPD10596.1 hypothetical protein [Methanoregulaceae archaeon]